MVLDAGVLVQSKLGRVSLCVSYRRGNINLGDN